MLRLDPIQRGFLLACGAILVLAACLIPGTLRFDAEPSPDLMRGIAQAGVGLLIAFSVTVAGFKPPPKAKSTRHDHESWLGFVVGCGSCSLLGIAAAFAISAHREAGHANLLDSLGLCWAVGSIGMLGILIATLPTMTYHWNQPD